MAGSEVICDEVVVSSEAACEGAVAGSEIVARDGAVVGSVHDETV